LKGKEVTQTMAYGFEAEHFGLSQRDAIRTLEDHGLTDDGWSVTYDGSVRNEGLEIVSAPLEPDTANDRLTSTVMTEIRAKGGTVDSTCGLHVHHGVEALSSWDIFEAVRHYVMFQPAIDSILPRSRRVTEVSPSYCHEISEAEINELADIAFLTSMRPAQTMGRDCAWWDRYRVVNVAAINKHGTLEFRQHSGTLNGAKIRNWTRLTRSFLRLGERHEPGNIVVPNVDVNDIGAVCRFLNVPRTVTAFYKARKASFGYDGKVDAEDEASYHTVDEQDELDYVDNGPDEDGIEYCGCGDGCYADNCHACNGI
jgi:hypothetical protein